MRELALDDGEPKTRGSCCNEAHSSKPGFHEGRADFLRPESMSWEDALVGMI